MDARTVTEPIYVIFTVGGDGKVKNAKVKNPGSPLFDAEALRVVSSMPDWKPGRQNGKPVPVYMQLPIDFNMKVPVKKP
jgi:TonB family protein